MVKKKYGFNMLWMFSKGANNEPQKPNTNELDFIAAHGFNFIRVPTDYRFWTNGEDYTHPDEAVLANIERYFEECEKRGLHMSLNLHRAPGYCINGTELEKHSLWEDSEAQEGFYFLWEYFAKRFKGVPSEQLSFDLLNEPPELGRRGFTRERHERVMREAIAAIRAVDPKREIVLNGIDGGSRAIPELADTGAVHSGRGYFPFQISHYKATWVKQKDLPEPVYPGTVGGNFCDRGALRRYYSDWLEAEALGVAVHIGEFGCFNKTPNDVALRWLSDLMSVYREFGWGYSMWNFKGPFGIVGHGRPGAVYTDIGGMKVDKALLELMINNRR
jgi:aryl-phospho-beta-D-glucosidase BglC (GH1 family)